MGISIGRWREWVQSCYMIIPLLGIKLITYYYLIGAGIFNNPFLLVSMSVFILLFMGISRSKIKHKRIVFLILYSFLSIIMFADCMYYNYYNQTVSVKQLWQAANVAKVPSSFVATLIPTSFILLLDIPFIYHYFKKDSLVWKEEEDNEQRKKRFFKLKISLLLIIFLFALNPFQSVYIQAINSVEFFSNHLRDVYIAAKELLPKKEVQEQEVLKTVNETVGKSGGNQLRGIGKGKNLIVIQIESFQNFLIGASYNGQILTPNLNQLIKKDSLYFDQYYSTIGKGNTVDAEFTSLNSLYPVIDREAYELYTENTFDGLPWLLKEQGYSAFAIHGYEETFWNRAKAYPYQGFEDFYSMEDLEQDELIGLGISDESVFRQTIPILKKQTKPFFSFIVTLTNHHPYILDEDKAKIKLLPEDEETKFGNYLQTVFYTDQAIGHFIDELKEADLYNNTIIALYGDHHGLNWTMDGNSETVGRFLGREYDYDEMMNVPFIIHIPGSKQKQTISTVGGQIDFLPTIANIMDISIQHPYVLGQDLVNAKEGFAAFTAYLFEGSFVKDKTIFEISREGVFKGSRAWELETGRELNYENYKKDYERAIKIKQASRDILKQDLISNYIKR